MSKKDPKNLMRHSLEGLFYWLKTHSEFKRSLCTENAYLPPKKYTIYIQKLQMCSSLKKQVDSVQDPLENKTISTNTQLVGTGSSFVSED
jgi:hypothetical protein